MVLTVADMKNILNEALEILDNYDEDMAIPLENNTYFMRSDNFLATRQGFIELDSDILDQRLDRAREDFEEDEESDEEDDEDEETEE